MCKGACCKTAAGIYAPEDLKQPITASLIAELLNTGKYGLDTIGHIYYLRPRHIGETAITDNGNGICINLTPTGCSLAYESRPFQCRALIPNYDGKKYHCIYDAADKAEWSDIREMWYPHQEAIAAGIKMYNRQDFLNELKAMQPNGKGNTER